MLGNIAMFVPLDHCTVLEAGVFYKAPFVTVATDTLVLSSC